MYWKDFILEFNLRDSAPGYESGRDLAFIFRISFFRVRASDLTVEGRESFFGRLYKIKEESANSYLSP